MPDDADLIDEMQEAVAGNAPARRILIENAETLFFSR
jgi:hypothetical protein